MTQGTGMWLAAASPAQTRCDSEQSFSLSLSGRNGFIPCSYKSSRYSKEGIMQLFKLQSQVSHPALPRKQPQEGKNEKYVWFVMSQSKSVIRSGCFSSWKQDYHYQTS